MQDESDYWSYRLEETTKKWNSLCDGLGLKQNARIEQFPKNYRIQATKLFTELQRISQNLPGEKSQRILG
ncbi:MAG: hypothetical protein AAF518_24670 [Spirochaetota bacterium]